MVRKVTGRVSSARGGLLAEAVMRVCQVAVLVQALRRSPGTRDAETNGWAGPRPDLGPEGVLQLEACIANDPGGSAVAVGTVRWTV